MTAAVIDAARDYVTERGLSDCRCYDPDSMEFDPAGKCVACRLIAVLADYDKERAA